MDLTLTVTKLVEEMRKAGGYPSAEALTELAIQIGSALGAKKDEVAILRLSPDERMLRFLFPIKLQRVGEIPMTTAHSLAIKTIRDKRGEIVNNFAAYKHPTVFESVDLSEEDRASPIQKIVSSPMITEGKIVGLIQVSHKGTPGGPIGPDFTQKDVTELAAVGSLLGCFISTLPFTPPKGENQPLSESDGAPSPEISPKN